MRLTKQQQLDLCAMRTREPTWSLATLGEWAREKFALDKAPGKSSVKRILDNESSLKRPSWYGDDVQVDEVILDVA
ncbi:Pdc2p [Phytophthora cinnamomi]|uniref:Pdc2p n=1 Tax=Phytophthora cinnamomi TaxID=4785 RepID=UPI003559905A|nr:Pdc2p [Phytophthora cinnamomi]